MIFDGNYFIYELNDHRVVTILHETELKISEEENQNKIKKIKNRQSVVKKKFSNIHDSKKN